MRRRSLLLAPLAPLLLKRARAAGTPPNVLLVIASQWRGQAVPWATDSEFTAPNLAGFGRESTTFTRTYAGYPRTIPARRILLDGRFAHTDVVPQVPADVPMDELSVGARLKAARYRTSRFGDDEVEELIQFIRQDAASTSPAPFYAEWTIEWTKSYHRGTGLMERPPAESVHLRANVPEKSEAEARNNLADFYARAGLRDRNFGDVLASLDTRELRENTLVVFTADRGEMFSSHGLTGDDSFYEECVRIPLAMRHPRLEAGSQRDMLVSQADVAPTILGLCGVPAPKQMQGRDLTALLTRNEGEIADAVFAEGRMSEPEEWRMLIHGYYKLVTNASAKPTHMFNLQKDPYELTNLANLSSEVLNRDVMVALLQLWRNKLSDGRDASGLRRR
jgi:arylsulfatase A-like enzyme